MTTPPRNDVTLQAWGRLEPYAQLIRSLLPRAAQVTLFDPEGRLRWSSETTTGPDLLDLVNGMLQTGHADADSNGQLRVLEGRIPVYVCWLRNAGGLIAAVAILCRSGGPGYEPRAFGLTYSLLRPVLECLRRDLLSRIALEALQREIAQLDRDLKLVLADSASDASGPGGDLKHLLQSTAANLQCTMAALIVPRRSIVLLHAAHGAQPDNALLARTHRQLLALMQQRSTPLILNQVTPTTALGAIAYRILACPVRHADGYVMGVLALFRPDTGAPLAEREARLADLMARKAAALIERSHDALSGLYTRAAFEQRMRAVAAAASTTDAANGVHAAASWSALCIDLDRLHVINERFGVPCGNAVIGRLGDFLRRRLPPLAFAARIGGGRFGALLPSGTGDAVRFAEALCAGARELDVREPGTQGDPPRGTDAGASLRVSISVGVAPLDAARGGFAHALIAAETACRAAKDSGRDRVSLYGSSGDSVGPSVDGGDEMMQSLRVANLL